LYVVECVLILNRVLRFNTYVLEDGHDVPALCKAFHDASTVKGKPSCILAKTFKGKSCPGNIHFIESLKSSLYPFCN